MKIMEKRKRISIIRRLSVSLIGIGVVIFIIAELISSLVLYRMTKTELIRNLEQMSDQSIQYLDTVMKKFEQDKRFLQNQNSLYDLLSEYEQNPNVKGKAQIEEFLNTCYSSFEGVYGLAVIVGGEAFYNIGSTIETESILESEWYQQYLEEGASRQYSPLVDGTGNINGEDKKWIFLVCPYRNKTIVGDIVFLIPFSVFEVGMSSYEKEIRVELRDSQDNLLFENQKSEAADETSLSGNWKGEIELKRQTGIGQWTMTISLSKRQIFRQFMPTFFICFAILAGAFLIIWIIILWMVAQKLRPLKDFSNQMEQISMGNENSKVELNTGDEFESIAETFNQMMMRIQNSVEEQILAEKKQKQLEYALIHAQIDPHFIYKALNVIIYLAQCGEIQSLIKVTHALIRILHDKLRIDQIDVYDSVENEIEIIQSYVMIWKVYYGEKICFEAEAGPQMRQKKLPKNILQPLVENAIFHGLLLNDDEDGTILGGTVSLKITEEDGYLRIEVKDDGYGMTQEQIQQVFFQELEQNVEKGMHIGIRNIRQRLNWIYQDDYSLAVESELTKGTIVTLWIREA